jgi:hypothetical protein
MSTPRFLAVGLILSSVLLVACSKSQAPAAAALPEQDGVYFITPRNGDVVTSPVTVRFGLKGRGVAPAGVNMPNTGHHHLIIDAPTPGTSSPIPADEKHVHFGGGQTQAVVQLTPGQHTLQLVLGDYLHVPQGEQWASEKITITVK